MTNESDNVRLYVKPGDRVKIDVYGHEYYVTADGSLTAMTEHGERSGACFAQERGAAEEIPSEVVTVHTIANEFSMVAGEELEQLTRLCAAMLDNGASMYEVQQRIMGF